MFIFTILSVVVLSGLGIGLAFMCAGLGGPVTQVMLHRGREKITLHNVCNNGAIIPTSETSHWCGKR